MVKRSAFSPRNRQPDRRAALTQYRSRANGYDSELALFEPLRREAIARLNLVRGATVLDVGCGTGLSFALLDDAVGRRGRIVGIEQCPEMMDKARERVAAQGWRHVSLIQAPAETARLDALADAALFNFTHDVLRCPEAIANILRHLKPGARVVATGLQWAPLWAWPVNLFVLGAALYSVTTMDGLGQPWSGLADQLGALDVDNRWMMGGIYMVTGTWRGAEYQGSLK